MAGEGGALNYRNAAARETQKLQGRKERAGAGLTCSGSSEEGRGAGVEGARAVTGGGGLRDRGGGKGLCGALEKVVTISKVRWKLVVS